MDRPGQRGSRSGDAGGIFEIQLRCAAAAQLTHAGAVVIGAQQLAESLADAAAGTDDQRLVAAAQAGQAHG